MIRIIRGILLCNRYIITRVRIFVHNSRMGLFDNKFYNFIMLFFVSGIIVQIMNFFDIEFVFYISYLLWFIAVGIFVIVLPRGQSSVI